MDEHWWILYLLNNTSGFDGQFYQWLLQTCSKYEHCVVTKETRKGVICYHTLATKSSKTKFNSRLLSTDRIFFFFFFLKIGAWSHDLHWGVCFIFVSDIPEKAHNFNKSKKSLVLKHLSYFYGVTDGKLAKMQLLHGVITTRYLLI